MLDETMRIHFELFLAGFAITGNRKYIFPSIKSTVRPMSENTVNAALRLMGYEKDEMTGHGFHSMDSTLLHEHGWPHEAIERQLAHGVCEGISCI